MTDKPYGNKPKAQSEANSWHEFRFKISIDRAVDWDKVDLRRWAQHVARYTAIHMAASDKTEEIAADDVVRTLLMNLSVSRITMATDEELHNLIDEFEEE